MDLAKYRAIFVEEATESLAEMSRALLALEKDARGSESLEAVFRAAHSIKGMAASLEYEAITALAHALEDKMQEGRAAGAVDPPDLPLLFRGLEALEGMVAAVREGGEPGVQTELVAALSAGPGTSGKKAPGPPRRASRP